ncbi:MAG: hypothetical protein RRB13_04465 [bacterium]|nr:hypothetical protein [bacterium]
MGAEEAELLGELGRGERVGGGEGALRGSKKRLRTGPQQLEKSKRAIIRPKADRGGIKIMAANERVNYQTLISGLFR